MARHPPHEKDIFHHFEKRNRNILHWQIVISWSITHPHAREIWWLEYFFFNQSCLFQKHKYILWRISIIIYVESFLQAIWFGFDLTHFMRTCFVLTYLFQPQQRIYSLMKHGGRARTPERSSPGTSAWTLMTSSPCCSQTPNFSTTFRCSYFLRK